MALLCLAWEQCLSNFGIFLWNIFITPSPRSILVMMMVMVVIIGPGAISSPLYTLCYHVLWYHFQVIGPTDHCEKVHKCCGQIETVISQLGSFVIPWKYVMIVVPSFTQCPECDRLIFCWIDRPEISKKKLKINTHLHKIR